MLTFWVFKSALFWASQSSDFKSNEYLSLNFSGSYYPCISSQLIFNDYVNVFNYFFALSTEVQKGRKNNVLILMWV